MFKSIRSFFLAILYKGEELYEDDEDKKRVVLYNFVTIGSCIFIFPTVIVVSVITENIYSLYTTIGFFSFVFAGIFLNWRGYNQISVIGLALLVLCINYYVLLIVPNQTGAPYGNLLLALFCLQLIRNRKLRIFFMTSSIIGFIIFNYIQLKYKTFNDIEYIPVVFVIFLMFIVLLYYDRLMESFRQKIQKQGEQLLELEQEKHQREIDLKQKDLENTLGIFSIKDQVTAQLVGKLKEALTSKNTKRELQRLVIDLQNQNESMRGKALVTQNIDEVNAEFYARLLAEFSTLTKGERELSAFLRLNLSNKEIAQLKNTTENTVNVAKSRLRKKMGFNSNKELREFLVKF